MLIVNYLFLRYLCSQALTFLSGESLGTRLFVRHSVVQVASGNLYIVDTCLHTRFTVYQTFLLHPSIYLYTPMGVAYNS